MIEYWIILLRGTREVGKENYITLKLKNVWKFNGSVSVGDRIKRSVSEKDVPVSGDICHREGVGGPDFSPSSLLSLGKVERWIVEEILEDILVLSPEKLT